ncbi:MAG TPA: hypothetical protein VGQ71_01805 [Terriglobales bacterium]|nr:hypothetical protein [Terriglobales bacterium]
MLLELSVVPLGRGRSISADVADLAFLGTTETRFIYTREYMGNRMVGKSLNLKELGVGGGI